MNNYDEDYDDYEYAEDYNFEYIVDGIELDLIEAARRIALAASF